MLLRPQALRQESDLQDESQVQRMDRLILSMAAVKEGLLGIWPDFPHVPEVLALIVEPERGL